MEETKSRIEQFNADSVRCEEMMHDLTQSIQDFKNESVTGSDASEPSNVDGQGKPHRSSHQPSDGRFDLRQANDEFQTAFGFRQTFVSGAKLIGKALFNSGVTSKKIGLHIIKDTTSYAADLTEEQLATRSDFSKEQREKFEGNVKKLRKIAAESDKTLSPKKIPK
jgi:hypothetical protein